MPPLSISSNPESKESHARKILRGKAVDSRGKGWYKLNYGQSGDETAHLGSGGIRDESLRNRKGDSGDEGGLDIKDPTIPPQLDSEKMAMVSTSVPGEHLNALQAMGSNGPPNPVLSQLAMEQILEDDYSDVEDQPSRRKFKNTPLGHFRCEHPSCWDTNDKFRFKVFADLADHYRNDHPNAIQAEFFPCDYPTCRRAGDEDAFTRKDAYRDHLRESHMEDMAKRHKTLKREQEWLASRVVSSKWWRCVQCLDRVFVASDGWACPSCKQPCEPERLQLRKLSAFQFRKKWAWKSDETVPEIERQASPSQHSIISSDDFQESRSKSQPMRSSSGDGTEGTLSASQTIRPSVSTQAAHNLTNEPSTLTVTGAEGTGDIGFLDKLAVDNAAAPLATIKFSHIEYTSHKIVPFITIKQLGHGSLGSVDAVRRQGEEGGIVLARKVVRLPNMARKRLLPLIQQEVAVLRELSHKHIVQVVSTYETTSVPRQFGILISPAGDEDLSHFLERVGENDFPEEDLQRLRKWQYCLASAVAYIHSQNIRHKDIKPSNAICKGDEIFLTDFGSAHQFSSGLTSSTEGYAVGVTKMYSAPEVVHEDRRGRPADVYSLGCVFSEMITVINKRGIEEFHDFRSEPIPDEPDRMTLCYHATAHKLEDWFATLDDSSSFALISKMMAQEQKLRPTADDVLIMIAEYYGPMSCNCGAGIKSVSHQSQGASISQALPEPKHPTEVEREDKTGSEKSPALPTLKQRVDAWYSGIEVENDTLVSINPMQHPSATTHHSLVSNSPGNEGLPFLGIHATKQINKHIVKPLLDKSSLEHFVQMAIRCYKKILEKKVVCLRDLEQELIVSASVSFIFTSSNQRTVTNHLWL
jgi:serine/threonine protein kinase